MQNRTIRSFLLGIGSAVVASASYALITPEKKLYSTELDTIASQTVASSQKFSDADVFLSEDLSFEYKINKGDTLSSIFNKLDFSSSDLHNIINSGPVGKDFTQIAPGRILEFTTHENGTLKKLAYKKNIRHTLVALQENGIFETYQKNTPIEIQLNSVSGSIDSSLFIDGKEAGLPDKIIMQLADIFAWDIDFSHDIRKGDHFAVVFEDQLINNQKVGAGQILAVEFTNHGKTHQAVRYKNSAGQSNFYTPEGKSVRKAFIRSPVDFARVSSPFNLRRKHPVLNRIRAHKGVDFAARTGTPVKSTGDGKIVFQGWKNGYGRVITVKHNSRFTTVYAHLSKFNKRYHQGSAVDQGDIIGYVGQSGLATGPHLHYEFRVNGQHRDPMRIVLPDSPSLEGTVIDDFKLATAPYLALLEQSKTTVLAQNQSN